MSSPVDLLQQLHAQGGDPHAKNERLRGLVLECQSAGTTADTASILLILALWPGLDAVHGRLRRYFRDDPQLLSAEIIGRVGCSIRTLDLTKVTWVAASIVRNAERDIRRMLVRERARAESQVEFDDEFTAMPTWHVVQPGALTEAEEESQLAKLTAQLRTIIGEDAVLVMSIAVRGEFQHAAAVAAGLSYDAARKRYQRAIRKLQARFS